MTRRKWAGVAVAGVAVALLAPRAVSTWLDRDLIDLPVEQNRVVSRDGTAIAYEKSGSGAAVILIGAALADREGSTRLANHLARRFTVINYDRRGRGASGDTAPYAVEREIEDIEALADAEGGQVLLFGSSSGAVLALDAAARLGPKARKVFLYEPPLIVDGSQPPPPPDLSERIGELVTAGRRDDAVHLFFARGMGLPDFAVTGMRWLMPGWSKMAAIAPTVRYDLAVLAGTQTGGALPAGRWRGVTAPVLVSVGSRSEPFFHTGARALVPLLGQARYAPLEGCDHSAILMAAGALAGAATPFFLSSATP